MDFRAKEPAGKLTQAVTALSTSGPMVAETVRLLAEAGPRLK
jgi:hypothetical protein